MEGTICVSVSVSVWSILRSMIVGDSSKECRIGVPARKFCACSIAFADKHHGSIRAWYATNKIWNSFFSAVDTWSFMFDGGARRCVTHVFVYWLQFPCL